MPIKPKEKWKLEGYDTFEGEDYSLAGEWDSEAEVVEAAKKRLKDLEKTQPSRSSGGQSGIQDQVFIIRPDGSKYRFFA